MEADFTGWATKAGIKCTDGRTIMPDAFKHQDGVKVPLVWHHLSKDPKNILGHAILKHDPEGVRTEAFFNDSETAKNVKMLLQHGDLDKLSIHANKLVERAKEVFRGNITEVSIVPAGANAGAIIENVRLSHGDYDEELEDEAVISMGLPIELTHADEDDSDDSEETVQDILGTLSEKQSEAVHYVIHEALKAGSSVEHSDESNDSEDDEDADNTNNDDENVDQQEGIQHMNVFEKEKDKTGNGPSLTHSQMGTILGDAEKMGSLKESILEHAAEYGIEDIEFLFPDAKNITTHPTFIKRRTEWVSAVLDGTHHSPFSRIKMLHADITGEEARAKGYFKGNLKKEEVFKLLKRKIEPTTVYKKQKLDRDDILDITDFDVVVWVKGEMRIMLDEEIASQVLVGDGREIEDDDAIDRERFIPIAEEAPLYSIPKYIGGDVTVNDFIDLVTEGMVEYEGSGSPTLFIRQSALTRTLLQRNAFGERVYKSPSDIAVEMGISGLRPVPDEIFDRATDYVGDDDEYADAPGKLQAILVNLRDYTIGADKGGRLGMFDDFDIDYNQHKYLLETRVSACLTKVKSAIRYYTDGTVIGNPVNPLLVNLANGEPEGPEEP